ncbi:MAG: hypothetical protein K6E16_06580, partial [Lachnospiraceae bacterium]|nr:hypothetical protein [Lachnospiraceae bacterium]
MKYGLRFPKRCPFGASFCAKWSVLLLTLMLLCGCQHADTKAEDTKAAVAKAAEPVIQITSQTDEGTDRSVAQEPDPTEAEQDPAEAFYATEITDELFVRMQGKSFKEDCTLSRDDLRYLHVLHKTSDGETKEGELVVNVHIAEPVLEIFRELYEADYPIEKIRLIDEYDADDERSMEDN